MSETWSEMIRREASLTTRTMTDHLRAVGAAIIEDAPLLAKKPGKLARLTIEAEIAPMEACTRITYRLERNVDPRLTPKEDDNG